MLNLDGISACKCCWYCISKLCTTAGKTDTLSNDTSRPSYMGSCYVHLSSSGKGLCSDSLHIYSSVLIFSWEVLIQNQIPMQKTGRSPHALWISWCVCRTEHICIYIHTASMKTLSCDPWTYFDPWPCLLILFMIACLQSSCNKCNQLDTIWKRYRR